MENTYLGSSTLVSRSPFTVNGVRAVIGQRDNYIFTNPPRNTMLVITGEFPVMPSGGRIDLRGKWKVEGGDVWHKARWSCC
jgi:hypothetical protein